MSPISSPSKPLASLQRVIDDVARREEGAAALRPLFPLSDADLARLRAEASGDDEASGTTLLVTHGGPIHLLLGHLKGMDARTSLREHSQSNCAVNELRIDGGDVEVVRENATEWES